MIAANELRRGNWFIDYETEPEKTIYYQVEEICKHNKEGKSIGVRFRQGSCWTNIDLIQPIPLIEDILLKLGAKKLVEFNKGYKRYNIDGVELNISPESDLFIEYVHQIPIKYLHTFQNFYYATKQKELEINL